VLNAAAWGRHGGVGVAQTCALNLAGLPLPPMPPRIVYQLSVSMTSVAAAFSSSRTFAAMRWWLHNAAAVLVAVLVLVLVLVLGAGAGAGAVGA